MGTARVNDKDGSTVIYSLDGRLVKTGTDHVGQALRQLPKGIYIVNGKKVKN
ncbi:MAG: T9SS type A sorting domain-containing protein [Prevotella sp.]|nr:T9SS type A sorting domain-containing protein [Prevotella sp.]